MTMQAPSFSLTDQFDATHALEDYRGRWLVLYFYPKDDTPGCTKEACAFRDVFEAYKEQGVVVLGLSGDSPRSHAKFAKKYNLNFPLLSDPDLSVIKSYKAWGMKKFMGREFEGILRQTYVIDPEGNIAKQYADVTPDKHAQETLNDLKVLMAV